MKKKTASDEIKERIVEFCRNNRAHIEAQFCDPLPDGLYAETLKVSNWKRICKDHSVEYPEAIERTFDCRPFDDQLRATVVSFPDGRETMTVLGE